MTAIGSTPHNSRSWSRTALFFPLAFFAGLPEAAAQLTLVEEGGFMDGDNLSVMPGATPFAIDSLEGFPIHNFTGLSDGIHGNSNSWIADSGSPGFAGIVLGSRLTVRSIAFGRDNTGQYADRALGRYVPQYTGVDAPSELTADADWIDIGEVNSTGTCPPSPALRHRYNFQAVEATAVRLVVPGTGLALGTCIDELEVYAEPAPVDLSLCAPAHELSLIAAGGPINTPALADEVTAYEEGNLARSPAAVPFATPPQPAPNHQIPGLDDGFYGNENSWLGNELGPVSRKVYAGIYFADGLHTIDAIALGRDNTGIVADRAEGPYGIEITTDELDPGDDASISSAKWVTLGQASGHLSDGQMALRHVYDLGRVEARALRVRTRLGNALDEIELLGEPPSPPGASFHRGDADGNGVLQLTDAIALLPWSPRSRVFYRLFQVKTRLGHDEDSTSLPCRKRGARSREVRLQLGPLGAHRKLRDPRVTASQTAEELPLAYSMTERNVSRSAARSASTTRGSSLATSKMLSKLSVSSAGSKPNRLSRILRIEL